MYGSNEFAIGDVIVTNFCECTKEEANDTISKKTENVVDQKRAIFLYVFIDPHQVIHVLVYVLNKVFCFVIWEYTFYVVPLTVDHKNVC